MANAIPIARFLRTVALLAAIATTVQAATPATTQAAKPRRGEILRIEKDTITVMQFMPRNNERGEPHTYALDENTQIYLSRFVKEETTAAGKWMRTYKTERGTRDDVQVGGLVSRIDVDGDRAARIILMPDDSEPKKDQK
jgi:hypothetical protein